MRYAPPRWLVHRDTTAHAPTLMALPSWVLSARTAEISETEAQAAFSGMQTVELTLPTAVPSGPVVTRYLKTAVEPSPEEEPPLLLVHGFDISLALEYRRLLPLLKSLGIEAYAPCIAGWGFTETTNLRSVRVEAKRAHLLAFWRSVTSHLVSGAALSTGRLPSLRRPRLLPRRTGRIPFICIARAGLLHAAAAHPAGASRPTAASKRAHRAECAREHRQAGLPREGGPDGGRHPLW